VPLCEYKKEIVAEVTYYWYSMSSPCVFKYLDISFRHVITTYRQML